MLDMSALAVTVEDADAYFAARALTGWPDDEPAKLAALRRGQDYIAREYNGRWSVEFANDDAPALIQIAIFDAAIEEARTPGLFRQVVKAADAKVLTGVGSIQWTQVAGGPTGVDSLRPRLRHVEGMLAPLIRPVTAFLDRA